MSKETTKRVREIVAKHYPCPVSYNDVRKDKRTRRIKFMRNGYIETPEFYRDASAAIKNELVAAGIWHRDEGFKGSECWRGEYVYYSVVIEG